MSTFLRLGNVLGVGAQGSGFRAVTERGWTTVHTRVVATEDGVRGGRRGGRREERTGREREQRRIEGANGQNL